MQLRPENKFQYLKVIRERSTPVDNVISVSDYPHFYQLKFDHNSDNIMYAVQKDAHSEIDIFSEKNIQIV